MGARTYTTETLTWRVVTLQSSHHNCSFINSTLTLPSLSLSSIHLSLSLSSLHSTLFFSREFTSASGTQLLPPILSPLESITDRLQVFSHLIHPKRHRFLVPQVFHFSFFLSFLRVLDYVCLFGFVLFFFSSCSRFGLALRILIGLQFINVLNRWIRFLYFVLYIFGENWINLE